jgi:hypothetical protein
MVDPQLAFEREILRLKALISAHADTCPDLVAATAPNASESVKTKWNAWKDKSDSLKKALADVRFKLSQVWRDPSGRIVNPMGWTGCGSVIQAIPADQSIRSYGHNENRQACEEILKRLNAGLQDLEKLTPGKPLWTRKRANCATLRSRLVERARIDKIQIEIPTIPKLAEVLENEKQPTI